jgi:hypothetical protein
MHRTPWKFGNRLVGVDLDRRRIWIGGQRLHHGVTGIVLAGAGLGGLAARKLTARGGLEWALLGTALIAHDWGDRSHWFRRGPGE